ncbi:DUF1304 family protein [Nocardioides dongxiaopingii]|uniref:DUF1304 domain-containing protein n=1 Tax=Nocardioides TaxID=1839 RepID=UPI0010C76380|nr:MULTISPECIES: DUF1304 domain-containing protein [Nocardioides]QCW51808.1 DUF1304 family protein [Nocardioides sp. S-1144]
MNVVAGVLVGLVAAIHVLIVVVEMALWTSPTGRRIFGTDPEFARATKALAGNQGLYNGFLVAGLGWGLVSGEQDVRLFFLGCVAVAGLYGAATVSPRILLAQTVPAVLAGAAVLAA